ncbi:MAG TPA: DUF87 domain-containing protein [Chloroflexi bacterium]|nr:DUF87 domain-containing protein [Chloroflexota bacterium]
MTHADEEKIGYVVGGSLQEGLVVRLTVPPQQLQEGAFVVMESGNYFFYGLVTDLRLAATNERFADEQLQERFTPALANMLQEQALYTNLAVHPVLMLEAGPPPESTEYERFWQEVEAGLRERPTPKPIKTVPSHLAPTRLATEGDIDEIFRGNFTIGYTREQGHPVRINLDKFVQRSAGVFGATGTGKSFLTRILLAGLIHHNAAATLIFDMHNEYAYDDVASDTNKRIVGLQTRFGSRVFVVGLGKNALIREHRPDLDLLISERDILPEDILLLARSLNLRETTATTLDALYGSFGDKWLTAFRKMKVGAKETYEDENGKIKQRPAPDSVEAWANEVGVNEMAAKALHDKLRRIFGRDYLVEEAATEGLRQIIDALEAGRHVILSFGDYDNELDYLLVTNLLTRKIREHWVKRTDAYRTGKEKTPPRPLVVVVEEAHKLLNREMAAQTTFSTIAREMRKYFVTLLIIDQRPSQIYDEVMSQLGTRISGWLGDEDDIRAVLSGLAGRDQLRGMLSRLQPKEEVLLLGWSVPIPLPVRSRRYDDKFWKDLLGDAHAAMPEDPFKALGF